MRGLSIVCILSASCAVGEPAGDSKAGAGLGSDVDSVGATPEVGILARVCAAGTTTSGVDVSYHNGTIDWAQVKAAGNEFAFVRISDGTGFHDPQFATNWAGAKAAGLVRGIYQFFRPSQDVAAQADMVIAAVGTPVPGDLPPVIDVEATGNLSPASVAAKVRSWVDRVKAATGIDPIVYTGKFFWRDEVGGPTSFAGNPLWIAQYTTLCPDLTSPWNTWAFWQYSETGKVPGISGGIDLDRFNGTLDELRALAGGGGGGGGGGGTGTCASATMAEDLPAGVCVQAASDRMWYQCDGTSWATPVDPTAATGPAGACAHEYPL